MKKDNLPAWAVHDPPRRDLEYAPGPAKSGLYVQTKISFFPWPDRVEATTREPGVFTRLAATSVGEHRKNREFAYETSPYKMYSDSFNLE